MSLKIYISGKFYAKEDAKISVYDHGLLYGDGIFEGLRSYGGKVFRLQEHLVRLYESAKAIWLTIPISIEQMTKDVNETLKVNNLSDAYIRLVVTRGSGSLGLDPNRTSDPQVIIIADKITLYPPEFYEKGLDIITASTIRNHPAALSPRIKSLNYLNNILAKIEGLRAGCIEEMCIRDRYGNACRRRRPSRRARARQSFVPRARPDRWARRRCVRRRSKDRAPRRRRR